MKHFTVPLKQSETIPENEINTLVSELLTNFKISNNSPSNKDWTILAEILDFVAQAEQTIAEQNERIKTLEIMTLTDAVTGLLNRRGIMREIKQAIAMANRYNEHSIFVYIDLDKFKQVNDTYGHAVGDSMLKFVASLLLSSIRQTDYAARLGGDEFALLLKHSDLEGGIHRTNFIQKKLNAAQFKYKNHTIPVRASFGIAEILHGEKIETIMKHSDNKMYYNKSIRNAN